MGCDIHLALEKKVNGKWQRIEPLVPSRWSDEEGKLERAEIYSDRNYDVFAMLANVRNGYGFAGCPTGSGFVPISEPKGIPEDASDEYKQKAEDYGCDGHSHSYLTLQELFDYDWLQESVHYGVVDFKTFEEWERRKQWDVWPSNWSASVSGGNTVTLPYEQGLEMLKNKSLIPADKHIYISINWKTTYAESAKHFISKVFPIMLKASEGNYSDVRVCFFFDN